MKSVPEFLRAKYDDVAFIDEGGFGRVYKCSRAGMTTAVKVLDDIDGESKARFQQEVESLQRVDHRHVVKILDAGITSNNYWYESEYANEGHFGKMAGYLFYSDMDRVVYFSQICLGVKALHELTPPIIHRDLKPSNILVFRGIDDKQYAVLKVADFGSIANAGQISRFTITGKPLGTEFYVAPEREQNPRIKTPQSDIYSLGITFLEACTGRRIPTAENLNRVPKLLRSIIEKWCEKTRVTVTSLSKKF